MNNRFSVNTNTAADSRITVRGELALMLVIVMNSLGVLLMLKSGSGISAISSVPYAVNVVLPQLSLGTWTYIFQGSLVISLMIIKKRIVPSYLFSFVVGFLFGQAMDMHELWVEALPVTLPLRFLYFAAGYAFIAFGIALSNRCQLPIIPTDLFPREFSELSHIPYARVKISCDVLCLAATALITFFFAGRVMGLGVGTVMAAFTMGKAVAIIGEIIDRHAVFVSCLSEHAAKRSPQPAVQCLSH